MYRYKDDGPHQLLIIINTHLFIKTFNTSIKTNQHDQKMKFEKSNKKE